MFGHLPGHDLSFAARSKDGDRWRIPSCGLVDRKEQDLTGSKSDWEAKRPSGGFPRANDSGRRSRGPSGSTRAVELVPGLTMSKSAFAGFCLTAFAGGVVTTVLVDRISGRSAPSAARGAEERGPKPAPPARPNVVPEFEALPAKTAPAAGATEAPRTGGIAGGIAIEPLGETRSANPSSPPPPRPARTTPPRGRTAPARKIAASAGASTATKGGGGELDARPRGPGWTDPFAD